YSAALTSSLSPLVLFILCTPPHPLSALSLHDALPIFVIVWVEQSASHGESANTWQSQGVLPGGIGCIWVTAVIATEQQGRHGGCFHDAFHLFDHWKFHSGIGGIIN